MVSTWTVIKTTQAMWIAVIATKIDITTAIIFLLFFSITHSTIALHYARQDDKKNLSFVDFLILTFIAMSSGIVFSLLGILSWRDELTIYIFWIVGSLLWIRGINAFINLFSKKLWINLTDKSDKNEK